jgi:hypothetical protein
MRYFVILFCLFIAAIEIAFPVGAVTTPPIDEVEAMLKKVESNLRQASAVVSVAKAKGEQMVEGKVQEKEQLKEAVVNAEAKAEVYAARMLFSGVDTTMPAKGEPIVDTVSINNMIKLNGL